MAHSALRFGVLGPLQMSANGTEMPLGAAKRRALLAVLLINRNRTVPIDTLIDAAWQQRPPPEARGSLHAHISQDPPNGEQALTSIQPPFWSALSRGIGSTCPTRLATSTVSPSNKKPGIEAAAAGRFESASGHLSAALAEWRGPVLEDLRDFQFVEVVRRCAGGGQAGGTNRAGGSRDSLRKNSFHNR